LPDQAVIHEKCISKNAENREKAAELIGAHFSSLPNLDQAWQDLHRLTKDEDRDVRWSATEALGWAFSHVPDKHKAWQDLCWLTNDEDNYVRGSAAYALGSAFSHVPDKDQAWQDLHRLTRDQESYVRGSAAYALRSAFNQVADKNQAWQDLHKLTQDEDTEVRGNAAYALGSAFNQVADKDQAWQDLHRLTRDQESYVRGSAAPALGSAFSQIADKDQVLQDLNELTQDENSDVRMYAYHSLGKASVFTATEANDRDRLKKNLEDAVAFFEKSSQESRYGPAKFCHPFYRSYIAITFQGANEGEIQRYLTEARTAVGRSVSKEELLEAVECLARALMESHRLKDRSVKEVASELNTYRWYCEKAADHMAAAEDKAPGAVKLMRKGNPLLEEQILATIREIQDIASQICQVTTGRGHGAESFCGQIKGAAKSLSEADLSEILKIISDFNSILMEKCALLPEDERDLVKSQLNSVAYIGPIPEKLDGIKTVVKFYLSRIKKDDEFLRRLGEMDTKIDKYHEITNNKIDYTNKLLNEIRYSVFQHKISFGNAIPNLTAMATELEKLHQIALQSQNSSLKDLYSSREDKLQELSKDLDNRLSEIKEILNGKPSTDEIKKILDKLAQLKPAETFNSKAWNAADKGATLLAYVSFFQEVIPIIRPLLMG
jgi:HEAT repeat protein